MSIITPPRYFRALGTAFGLAVLFFGLLASDAHAGPCTCSLDTDAREAFPKPGDSYSFNMLMRNEGTERCLYEIQGGQFMGDGTLTFAPSLSSVEWLDPGQELVKPFTVTVPTTNSAKEINAVKFRALIDGEEICKTNIGKMHRVCIVPTGVNVATSAWSGVVPSAHEFVLTLEPSTTDFEGRKVMEGSASVGTDTCFDVWGVGPGCTEAFVAVTNDPDDFWTTQLGNSLNQPDTVGYGVACADHYSTVASSTCSASVPQTLFVECPSMGNISFHEATPDIGATVEQSTGLPTTTTLKSRSNAVEASRSWP